MGVNLKFVSKRAAREWLKRSGFNDWGSRTPTTDSPRVATLAKTYGVKPGDKSAIATDTKAMTKPERKAPLSYHGLGEPDNEGRIIGGVRFLPGDPNDGKSVVARPRVRKHSGGVQISCINGVWRRYSILVDGSKRFVSDHASQDDASLGRNPLADHSVTDRSHTVVQSVKDWRGA
jgi:hypothetical protein